MKTIYVHGSIQQKPHSKKYCVICISSKVYKIVNI
ncbi:hypothetical protein BVRB_3g052020 [Beta vulgaris subsp. vulgaris]|nr:hypothetical protein BVRB_3g052020 [Beta vulgaris subsp. vulgaris]